VCVVFLVPYPYEFINRGVDAYKWGRVWQAWGTGLGRAI